MAEISCVVCGQLQSLWLSDHKWQLQLQNSIKPSRHFLRAKEDWENNLSDLVRICVRFAMSSCYFDQYYVELHIQLPYSYKHTPYAPLYFQFQIHLKDNVNVKRNQCLINMKIRRRLNRNYPVKHFFFAIGQNSSGVFRKGSICL